MKAGFKSGPKPRTLRFVAQKGTFVPDDLEENKYTSIGGSAAAGDDARSLNRQDRRSAGNVRSGT